MATLLVVIACAGSSAATTTTTATTTTAPTTTTTETPTTTTTETPTTTIAIRTVTASIDVYDDSFEGDLVDGSLCTTTGVLTNIREGANLLIEDASTGEVLGVTQLEQGFVEYENVLGVPDNDLFWYCSFLATFTRIPLDREFYLLLLENDEAGGLTFSKSDIRTGTVGQIWFDVDQEDIRNTYR